MYIFSYRIGRGYAYYEKTLKRINGILLPGGGAAFLKSKAYLESGRIIYKLAVHMNNKGDYFPIWGTCLGFELLLYICAKDEKDPRRDCGRINQSLPLRFKFGFKEGRMFQDTPQDIVDILATERVTYNYHKYCITPGDLHCFGLDKDWHITSLSFDSKGVAFISTIEHRLHPFYGVQFHPEKNAYDFTDPNINHSQSAIKASRYFASFFINECKQNRHCFFNEIEETRHLIYNFPVTFARAKGNKYLQCYFFTRKVDYPLCLVDANNKSPIVDD